MKKLSEVPFIHISKENLEAASDMLEREQKGELMEMIIDAVLNDSYPTSDDRIVRGVFNQFMSVIERKAKGYANRVEALEKVNEAKRCKAEEPQVTTNLPPMEEQSIDVNGKEEWLKSLIPDNCSPTRKQLFDAGWWKYYPNAKQANDEAVMYLRNHNRMVSGIY